MTPTVEFVRGLGERCRLLRGVEVEASIRKAKTSEKEESFHLGRASVFREISDECKRFQAANSGTLL